MPTDTLPPWLDARAIDTVLSREKAPDSAELTEILDKSLALEPLGLQEAAALMRVSEAEDLARMLARGRSRQAEGLRRSHCAFRAAAHFEPLRQRVSLLRQPPRQCDH